MFRSGFLLLNFKFWIEFVQRMTQGICKKNIKNNYIKNKKIKEK